MTITIQNKIDNFSGLSPEAQLMIELIPEGERWFELSSQPNAPSFHFDSEIELLVAVLDGLHSSDLLYLKQVDLFVDPERLMSLGEEQLQTIVDSVHTGKNKKKVNTIIKNAGLLNNGLLKQAKDTFLDACDLNENSLFQTSSLNDYIALYTLSIDDKIATDVSNKVNVDAANYAVAIAQTPLEFCDFYRFYIITANKLNLVNASSALRKKRIIAVYESLASFAHSMLVCPQVSGLTNSEQINQSIQAWLEYSGMLGFSSFTTALLQLVKNISLDNLNEEKLASEVNNYKEKMQGYFAQNNVLEPILSQDGKTLGYPGEHDDPNVLLSLTQTGCLAVEEFTFQVITENTIDEGENDNVKT